MGRTFLGFCIIVDTGLGVGVFIPSGVFFPEPVMPPPGADFVPKKVSLPEGASPLASIHPPAQLPAAFPLSQNFQPPARHAYAQMGEVLRLERQTLPAADSVCCNTARPELFDRRFRHKSIQIKYQTAQTSVTEATFASKLTKRLKFPL